MTSTISDQDVEQHLQTLPAWEREGDSIVREREFPDFAAAIAFVNRVAELAEAESHLPDIDIRYRTVTIAWTTHSAGGITERDRELAARTERLLAG
jgi:4a-hydroxytetrahydrobiopterin dehydratase